MSNATFDRRVVFYVTEEQYEQFQAEKEYMGHSSLSNWLRHVLVTAVRRYRKNRESKELEREAARKKVGRGFELYQSGWPKLVSCPTCKENHDPVKEHGRDLVETLWESATIGQTGPGSFDLWQLEIGEELYHEATEAMMERLGVELITDPEAEIERRNRVTEERKAEHERRMEGEERAEAGRSESRGEPRGEPSATELEASATGREASGAGYDPSATELGAFLEASDSCPRCGLSDEECNCEERICEVCGRSWPTHSEEDKEHCEAIVREVEEAVAQGREEAGA